MTAKRVTVVGGGVIGLCAAYYLAKAGADVSVLERGAIGSGASGGNAGWICPSLSGPLPTPHLGRLRGLSMLRRRSALRIAPLPDAGMALWLWRFWRRCNRRDHLDGLHAIARLAEPTMRLYDELAADGVTFEMHRSGLLVIFPDDRIARRALAELAPAAEHGFDVPGSVLGETALRSLEPALAVGAARAGFLMRGERHVRPETLVAGLAARLRTLEVVVREGMGVSGFDRGSGRTLRVLVGEDAIETEAVLLCAGAWSGRLAASLGVPLPVAAAKGHSFSVVPPVLPARPLYLAAQRIACSPFGGELRIAGAVDIGRGDTPLDPARIEWLRAAAARALTGGLPGKVGAPWAGLRPLVPDGLPVLGRLGALENVYVATGHSTLGMTLGPATGRAMAGLVLGAEEDKALLAPFSPDRF